MGNNQELSVRCRQYIVVHWVGGHLAYWVGGHLAYIGLVDIWHILGSWTFDNILVWQTLGILGWWPFSMLGWWTLIFI